MAGGRQRDTILENYCCETNRHGAVFDGKGAKRMYISPSMSDQSLREEMVDEAIARARSFGR